MLLNLTDLSAEPLHSQIANQLTDLIIEGELPSGSELPPARRLAREQRVSTSTVQRAYNKLAQQGLLRRSRSKPPTVPPLSDDDRQVIALTRHNGRHSLFNAIESFSRELISAIDTDMICCVTEGALKRFIQTVTADIALYDHTKGEIRLGSSGGSEAAAIGGQDPFWQQLRQGGAFSLTRNAFSSKAPGTLLGELVRRGAHLVMPLNDAESTIGLIALGPKRNGTEYRVEDLNLLKVIANQFTTAIGTMRLYIEALEKRRMDEELRIAHEIQMNLLPDEIAPQDGLLISASTTASHTVGGDFYDYFTMEGGRTGFVIADASGHGMPAAILISQIQAIVRSEMGNGNTIGRTMNSLNRQLNRQAESGFFATLFYGIIDQTAGTMEFANAGHDFPILVRRNGQTVMLKSTGPALGVLPETEYGIETVSIQEGDCILLYTDGVTETISCSGKPYGASRLRDLLIGNRHRRPDEIIAMIRRDLEWFGLAGQPEDDRTLVALSVAQLNERISDAA
jgi:serine phosphatase RsbU (regulator of sigma subunit)/DNA-binding transcriptional regulator YhcF (GntR family)